MGAEEVLANYNAIGIRIIEDMYGPGYLSFGGDEATDALAEMAELDAAHHVLDIGSGLGGPAMRLASTVGCAVTGIDLVDLNVEEARRRSDEIGLEHVSFEVADATALPFADEAFDVAWGLDAWCHVPDKAALIAEAVRVLRPGGTLAFSDWMRTGDLHGARADLVHEASATENLASMDDYTRWIQDNDLTVAATKDTSAEFLATYRRVMADLDARKDEIIDRYSARVYDVVIAKNSDILAAMEDGLLGGGRIVARTA